MSLAPAPTRTRSVVPLAADLERHGDRLAVVSGGAELTYAGLAERVGRCADRLDGGRRLVLIAGESSLDALVTYLGALAGGHVPMLVPDGPAVDELVAHYRPDVVARRAGGEWRTEILTAAAPDDLHPDLALLLTTSGSTGSPKMVRLSHANVQANAESIVASLGITERDRAITTLPLYYSYGLSVVHTHLLAGATLVLTDLSVVDPCFWDLCARTRPTSIAGVPHTFELLGRVGFEDRARELGSLRQVTQAGGRMHPEAVRRWAEAGQRTRYDFVVMYGQTEATARMAVLDPELATVAPDAVGRAVPGGLFRVDNPGACGAGELVYAGPNVMLGYAHCAADLALGAELTELRTGDIARLGEDGLVRIVGRRSRFAKIVGLRIDLDRIPTLLADHGVTGAAVDLGDRIGVFVTGGGPGPREIARRLATSLAVPYAAVDVRVAGGRTDLPHLPSGKPDFGAIRAHFEDEPPASEALEERATTDPDDRLGRVLTAYRRLLDAPEATPDDSFVGLGGDSLSYVEVSIHLERILGDLPEGWHLLSLRDLAATEARPSSRATRGLRRVETGIVLRSAAIVLVLVTHTGVAGLQGGAHVLLALAGFNMARFQLGDEPRLERLRGLGSGLLRVVVPAVAWILGVTLVTGQYDVSTVLLLNQVVGDRSGWSEQWSFWFIESLAYVLVGLAAALAVPAVDRWQRRAPWVVAMVAVGVGLLGRYAVLLPEAGRMRGGTAYVVLWVFALGWAAAASSRWWQRLVVSAVLVATVPGFWPTQPLREVLVVSGVLLLVWLPSLRVPDVMARTSGVLASASLYIYLTHWQVYPVLQGVDQWLAVAGSIAVGLAYWRLVTAVSGQLRTGTDRLRTQLVRGRVRGRRRRESPAPRAS